MRELGGREPADAATADDELALLFMCCHPALDRGARTAVDAALRGRARHVRDRRRVPGAGARDGQTSGAGEAEDPAGKDPGFAFPRRKTFHDASATCSG